MEQVKQVDRKKTHYHMNVGGASIMLLVLVIALTVFALLSVRAAYQEKKLAENARSAVEVYYSADRNAERVLARLNEMYVGGEHDCGVLAEAAEEMEGVQEAEGGDGILSYRVEAGAGMSIMVELAWNDMVKEGNPCTIKSWKLSAEELEGYGSDTVEIWNPEIEIIE